MWRLKYLTAWNSITVDINIIKRTNTPVWRQHREGPFTILPNKHKINECRIKWEHKQGNSVIHLIYYETNQEPKHIQQFRPPVLLLFLCRRCEPPVKPTWSSLWSSSSSGHFTSLTSSWLWSPWRTPSRIKPPSLKPNRRRRSTLRSWRRWRGEKRRSDHRHENLHRII